MTDANGPDHAAGPFPSAHPAGRPSPLRVLLDGLYLVSGWLAGAFLVAIFLLMLALSIGRQIGVNIPSGDEFVGWCLVASAFLGLAHTFKSGEMIRVGLLIDKVGAPVRHGLEIFALALAALVSSYFAWFAGRLAWDSYRFGDLAQGVVPVPLVIPQSGYALGLAILTVAVVDELVRVLSGQMPTYHKEPPRTADEVVERAIQSAV